MLLTSIAPSLTVFSTLSKTERSLLELYLTFPKQALVFKFLQLKSFENTIGKREIACHEQFFIFPQCFHRDLYLFGKLSVIYSKFDIVVCKLFEFGRV